MSKLKYIYGFLIIFILIVGIEVAKANDLWVVQENGSHVGQELNGNSIDEIKGTYSIAQVIDAYGLDKKEFYEAVNLSEDVPESTLIKDLTKVSNVQPKDIYDYVGEFLKNK